MALNPLEPLEALEIVVEFAQLEGLKDAPAARLRRIEREVQGFINRETSGHWRWDADKPDWRLLETMRGRARQMLNGFVEQKIALAGDLRLTHVVIREPGRVRIEIQGPPVDRLLFQISRVLEAAGASDRLLKCPACGRLFVKKTRKTYCSTRCQNRIYQREYRNR